MPDLVGYRLASAREADRRHRTGEIARLRKLQRRAVRLAARTARAKQLIAWAIPAIGGWMVWTVLHQWLLGRISLTPDGIFTLLQHPVAGPSITVASRLLFVIAWASSAMDFQARRARSRFQREMTSQGLNPADLDLEPAE